MTNLDPIVSWMSEICREAVIAKLADLLIASGFLIVSSVSAILESHKVDGLARVVADADDSPDAKIDIPSIPRVLSECQTV